MTKPSAAKTSDQTADLARGLAGLLADSYLVYNATQAAHWNVEGPGFAALHEMFEEQYRELAEAIDEIAERIRAIGYYTPGTIGEFQQMTRISQAPGLRGADEILAHLIEIHQQVTHRLRELLNAAEAALDEASLDLITERLRVHDKTIWMLKAQAGRSSGELADLPRAVAAS